MKANKELLVIRGVAILLVILVITTLWGVLSGNEIILCVAFVLGLVEILLFVVVLLLRIFDKI